MLWYIPILLSARYIGMALGLSRPKTQLPFRIEWIADLCSVPSASRGDIAVPQFGNALHAPFS